MSVTLALAGKTRNTGMMSGMMYFTNVNPQNNLNI